MNPTKERSAPRTLSFKIQPEDEKLYKALKETAKSRMTNRSSVIRQALIKELLAQETPMSGAKTKILSDQLTRFSKMFFENGAHKSSEYCLKNINVTVQKSFLKKSVL